MKLASQLERMKELEADLANSRKALSELHDEMARYQVLVDQASDLIHSVTPDGRFIYVNDIWKEVLGYTDAEIASLRLMDIVDPKCKGKCQEIFNCLIQGERIDRNQTTFITKDGSKIQVEGSCRTHFEDGEPVMMTGIFRDITEESRHAEELQASEMRYRDLFENAHDLIQIVRPDGRLLYVNKSWRNTFGYFQDDIAAGLSIFDLIDCECQDHCQRIFGQVISSGNVHDIQTTFIAKDGRKVIIEGNAKCRYNQDGPLYTQCIFHDVTEKRKMEEELLKAQKLESIGVFAGGIAHDFNNLLTAIMGNISMAKLSLDEEHPAWIRLDRTEKASIRAQGLTQQLLTFSKGGAPIRKTTSLNELLEDSVGFTLRGSSVRINYALTTDLWPAKVDQGQISQVAQNLALNASQAMPDGGIFMVKSENITIKEYDRTTLEPGKYVHLIFEDDGHGIAAENLPKIFDPYFSGKETGSGLGLAISYSVISQHNGLISVESKEGIGTTFHIYLPAEDGAPDVDRPEEAEDFQPIAGRRILFMDDDEIVIDVAGTMLVALGCHVEIARNGQEAIDIYQTALDKGEPFDGVIMDLTIPGGMGGKEAISKLHELDPDVKAIVSSGYATDPIMAQYKKFGFIGVVPKPYSIDQFRQALALFGHP